MAQSAKDLNDLGASLYNDGDWRAAVKKFSSLQEQFPESQWTSESYFFVGEAFMQLQDHVAAQRAFRKYLEDPAAKYRARSEFRLAEALFFADSKNAVDAFAEFCQKYERDPLLEFALPYLGESHLRQNQAKEAQAAFESALKQFPQSSVSNKSRLGLARALQMQGDSAQAKRFYQYLIDLRNESFSSEALFHLGMDYLAAQDHDNAARVLRELVADWPGSEFVNEANYWLARCSMADKNWQDANEIFNSVATEQFVEPLASAAQFDKSICLIKTDRWDRAAKQLERLLARWPKSRWCDDALQLLIEIDFRKNNLASAIRRSDQFYRQFSKSDRRDAVDEVVGRCHYMERRYAKAETVFERLLNGGKLGDRATVRYLLAISKIGLKKYAEAAELLKNGFDADELGATGESARLAYATALFGAQNFADAVPVYEKICLKSDGARISQRMLKNRENARYVAELALCYTKTEALEKANQIAVEIDPKHQPTIEADQYVQIAIAIAEAATETKQNELAHAWYQVLTERRFGDKANLAGYVGLAWLAMDADGATESAPFEALMDRFGAKPAAIDALMARAIALEKRGKSKSAARLFDFVSQNSGGRDFEVHAIFRSANLQLQNGDAKESEAAIAQLLQLLEKHPQHELTSEAHYLLAWAYRDGDQLTEAKKHFSKIVADHQTSRIWTDAVYRLGQLQIEAGQLDQAIDVLAQLNPAKDDVSRQGILLLGRVYSRLGKWNELETAMDDLIPHSESTSQANAKLLRAESFFQRSQPKAALKAFKEIENEKLLADAGRRARVAMRIAQCFAYSDQWKSAEKAAQKALADFPQFPNSYELEYLIARSLAMRAEFEKARQGYRRVIESKRGSQTETAAMAQWMIGETYFHQEDYPAAIDAYRLVKIRYAYPRWTAAACLQAGKCSERLKEREKAIKFYRDAVAASESSKYGSEANRRLQKLKIPTRNASTKSKSSRKEISGTK